MVRTIRSVPKLDGARGKKQVWRPHVRTLPLFGIKCTALKKVRVALWDFSAPRELRPPGYARAKNFK